LQGTGLNKRSLAFLVKAATKNPHLFGINLGENSGVPNDAWEELLAALPDTRLGMLFIEPGAIGPKQKVAAIASLRENRDVFRLWWTRDSIFDTLKLEGRMWWNVKNTAWESLADTAKGD
jgi:hypothetical protein